MFCEVERSYIEDGFNLYGLRACVSNFSDCLDLILDRIGPDDSDDSHLTQSACTLYGLIHARYIITAHGLDAMYNKVSTFDETGRFDTLCEGLRSYSAPWIFLSNLSFLVSSHLFTIHSVRGKRLWNLPLGTVWWPARLTCRIKR